jgi:hypothetical protein
MGLANQASFGIWKLGVGEKGRNEENTYALYQDTLEVQNYFTVSYIQIKKKF